MPIVNQAFRFFYVTCLPHLPEDRIGQAIKELFRVCRVGVVLQGVTTDMTEEVIEDYELFAGFQLAAFDPVLLDEVWRIEQEADEDDWDWYPNKETIRQTFFSKPQIER